MKESRKRKEDNALHQAGFESTTSKLVSRCCKPVATVLQPLPAANTTQLNFTRHALFDVLTTKWRWLVVWQSSNSVSWNSLGIGFECKLFRRYSMLGSLAHNFNFIVFSKQYLLSLRVCRLLQLRFIWKLSGWPTTLIKKKNFLGI